MKIGNIYLKYGLFLAPMAGVTDFAMRQIAKEHGAEMITTEMLSAKAIHYGDEKTESLASFNSYQRPLAIQIFGSEPEIMSEAAFKLEKRFCPDIIDINMGCPVKKVAGNGEGSALMKNPTLAAEIVRQVKSAINIPVTVKIRSGWDNNSKNAPEFAALMEEAGALAITVHARTRTQMYEPGIDMEIIRKVKETVSCPVIGNGDIVCADDALRMFKYTDCDGIMIGRGAYGNPWIFEEIKSALNKTPYSAPNIEQRMETAKKQVLLMIEDKGEYTAVREARKHLSAYIKFMRGAAQMRVRINAAEDADSLFSLLDELAEKQ